MTLTSHGHHIPGTPDTDEDIVHDKIRCGGISVCKTCREEVAGVQILKESKIEIPTELLTSPEEEPRVIPIEIWRPIVRNVGAMEFTGGEESAVDIMSWLANTGIHTTYWPDKKNQVLFPASAPSRERVEYMNGRDRVAQIFKGDWLIHRGYVADNWREPHPVDFFQILRPHEFESHYERAMTTAPVPWYTPFDNESDPKFRLQPELDDILKLKKEREVTF